MPNSRCISGRKGSAEPFFFYRGAIDDLRLYGRALRSDEIAALAREGGWNAVPVLDLPVRGDPVSGRWAHRATVYLDLQYDGDRGVAGKVMSGSPDDMVEIATGTFDRSESRIRLTGTALQSKTGAVGPFSIDGTLDGGELTVHAVFADYSANLILTRT